MLDSNLPVRATTLLLVFAFTFGSFTKRAEGRSKSEACARAYESAQELRKLAKLLRAQEMLEQCTQRFCGKFIQRECEVWLEQLRKELPSVIVSATDGSGATVADVEITLDGTVLTSSPDGDAIRVDPGVHEFRFNAEGHAEVSRRVEILPGQQDQPLHVRFLDEAQRSGAPAGSISVEEANHDTENQRRTGGHGSGVPYVVGGVGVLGVLGFGLVGALARNAHSELRACAPACPRAKAEQVSRLYAIANVSLGVGIVGVGTAAALLLTSRDNARSGAATPPRHAKVAVIDVRQTHGGVFAELRGSF